MHQQGPSWPSGPETFEAMLARVGKALDEAMAGRRATDARLHSGLSALMQVQGRVDEIDRHVQELDRRFTEMLAERYQREQPDTLGKDDLEQYELTDKIETLFLDIDLAYRNACQARGVQQDIAERAKALFEIANELFGPGRPDLSWLAREFAGKQGMRVLEDFQMRALGIRQRADQLDRSHSFKFNPPPDQKVLDKNLQKAWARCDPDGEVAFVVTPAYVVGQRVYVRQQVFTQPVPGAPDSPPTEHG